MSLSEKFLYRLARRWPEVVKLRDEYEGLKPGTDEYEVAYSQMQLDQRFRRGIDAVMTDKETLEIGCGHGGIACFMALAGATKVVAVDINKENLELARRFAGRVSRRFGADAALPIEFLEMDAYELQFPDASFDVIVSDNSFEHFMRPERVMQESFRVLRPGGRLVVPGFSSILCKYGLHLKFGFKVPWANLFFSEATIIRVVQRLVREDERLLRFYPRAFENPTRVRDLRPYGDLNDITFRRFRQMAHDAGFVIEWFRPFSTRLGKIVSRLPLIKNTNLNDIFSNGAAACLRKPAGQPASTAAKQ